MRYIKKEERIISISKATLAAFPMIIPIFLAFGLPYLLIYKRDLITLFLFSPNMAIPMREFFRDLVYLTHYIPHALVVLIVGIVLHEGLHGFFWGLLSKPGFKAIRFGVKWELLTPYTHCLEPITARVYRIGGIMPAIVLGILPAIIGLIVGGSGWVIFGIFFTWSAGGDFLILWLIRDLPGQVLVLDHPNEAGCIIVEENNNNGSDKTTSEVLPQ
jgi:hypothetical protein